MCSRNGETMGRCTTLPVLCFAAGVAPLAQTEQCLSLDGRFEPTARVGQRPRVILELDDRRNSHQLLTEVVKIVRAPRRGRHPLDPDRAARKI